ncbi:MULTISPECIES: hypothetical protein [Nitrosopumilus]|uniref:hypothetical protein n=1 Tax=Nitrosopumilus TaxID=338191 RepID=UPI0011E5B10C|nr:MULTISPECIES: hypothetical protein [Nitrosopumilus]
MFFLSTNYAFAQSVSQTEIENFYGNFTLSLESPEDYVEQITKNLAAGSSVYDLALYMLSMAVYAVFVWHFYRFISRREIIPIDYDKYGTDGKLSVTRIAAYAAAHVFLFPLIIFVWFLVYSFFMFILAKDMPIDVVVLVSISIIGATRITSYYKEDLAKDVGKLLPFALLGIFLTSAAFYTDTSNFFSIEEIESKLSGLPILLSRIIEFVIIIVAIEVILRTLFLIKRKLIPTIEEKLEEQIEDQIDEKIKTHVEKIEKNQKNLEKKIEEETDSIEKKIEKETDDIEKKIQKDSSQDSTLGK